jgi:hypothetical protein
MQSLQGVHGRRNCTFLAEGARLWEAVRLRLEAASIGARAELGREVAEPAMFGEPYFPFAGRELWLPPNPRERPGRELLEWHGDVVFRP